MAEPWLAIIGLGEDGPKGLGPASRKALSRAEFVFGGRRHLDLMGIAGQEWPLPFSLDPVLALRGQKVAVLASGDPFWFGVGGSLSAVLDRSEWQSFPAPSTFSHAAALMGWRLEEVTCLGLHAAPMTRLFPHLSRDQRLLCLLRDGKALAELASYLTGLGFGTSQITALSALGGPRQTDITFTAESHDIPDIPAPAAAAILVRGPKGLPRANGLDDGLFDHDGQITKRPIRALTLSALAPRAGEVLWDIGAGSGSVSVEFLLSAPATQSHAIEADPTRAARARRNADRFGLAHRFHLTEARAPEGLEHLPRPDAVFIGGGFSPALMATLWPLLPQNARLVVNAVTLEGEALLIAWNAAQGGTLLRIDLAQSAPLGSKRGWVAMRPIVQWSVSK